MSDVTAAASSTVTVPDCEKMLGVLEAHDRRAGILLDIPQRRAVAKVDGRTGGRLARLAGETDAAHDLRCAGAAGSRFADIGRHAARLPELRSKGHAAGGDVGRATGGAIAHAVDDVQSIVRADGPRRWPSR